MYKWTVGPNFWEVVRPMTLVDLRRSRWSGNIGLDRTFVVRLIGVEVLESEISKSHGWS